MADGFAWNGQTYDSLSKVAFAITGTKCPRFFGLRDKEDRPPVVKAPSVKPVRCAVYTRVSTEHGLDQEFNSLDAQHDAASAYIKSQARAGWTLIRSRYDDGGYSGGSTDRPDLQRLLDDVRARKIDVIVVYKVDRLTRSLADFAKLVELFDAPGVSFVSVTQQFNTTTSMGRLTLNVLLSFAQFEREVTSERIRDKIAASKRKGLWVGGNLPLGYKMMDGKIAIVEEEAELVRSIFRRYLELGSVNELLRDLKERNIRTKARLLSTGATRGGIPFGRGALYYVLANRFYIGEVKYKDEILPGEQPPVMDPALFEAVRQKSLTSGKDSIDALGHEDIANAVSGAVTGLILQDWSGARAYLEIAREEMAKARAGGSPFIPNDKPKPIEREWARHSIEWEKQQRGEIGSAPQTEIPAHHVGRSGQSFDDEMNEKFRSMGLIG